MASYQQEITRGKSYTQRRRRKKKVIATNMMLYTGRKRRNSEDEEMADASAIKPATTTPRRSFKCVKLSENSKRNPKRSTRGALLGNI